MARWEYGDVDSTIRFLGTAAKENPEMMDVPAGCLLSVLGQEEWQRG